MDAIVSAVDPASHGEVVDVLRAAFHDYPVMRHVIGAEAGYDARVRTLIDFFVTARHLRGEPVLGVQADGRLLAAALVTLPGDRPSPPALDERRQATWTGLGPDARARYEAYGAVAARHHPPRPHHHLNMVGVRPSHVGRGLARALLQAVHELVERNPDSAGVSLNTELVANVSLYERFGYGLLGHERVSPRLESWSMFRPRRGAGDGPSAAQ